MKPLSSHPDGIVSCWKILKWTWLLAMLVATVLSAGCSRGIKEEPPTPAADTRPEYQLPIPDSPEGRAIVNHLNVVYAIGPDAEKNYQASLDTLRKKLPESIHILFSAYREIDRYHYGDRWVMVQTLADLQRMPALDELSSIAGERLPAKDTIYGHEVYPYEEESIIRITALKGIGNLTAVSDSAVMVLQPYFAHPDTLIRIEAINALADGIRLATADRQKLMMRYLPKDYVFLLDLSSIQPTGILGEAASRQPSGEGNGPAPKQN